MLFNICIYYIKNMDWLKPRYFFTLQYTNLLRFTIAIIVSGAAATTISKMMRVINTRLLDYHSATRQGCTDDELVHLLRIKPGTVRVA